MCCRALADAVFFYFVVQSTESPSLGVVFAKVDAFPVYLGCFNLT